MLAGRHVRSAAGLLIFGLCLLWSSVFGQAPTQSSGVVVPTDATLAPAETATFSPDFQKALDDYFKTREAKKQTEDDAKAKELVAKGLTTGTKLPLQAYWDNRLFFETPGKEWRFALGGRLQFEPIFWSQTQSLKGAFPGNGGLARAKSGDGVGVLDDGMIFRRVRFRTG